MFDLGGSPAVRASGCANNDDLRRFDLGQDETHRQEEFVREQVLAAEQMAAAQAMTMEAEAAQQAWTLGEQSQQAQAMLQEQVDQQALAHQTEQAHAAFRQAVEEQLMRTAQEQAHGGSDGGGSLSHPSEELTREEAARATQSYSTTVGFQAGMTNSMNAVFHNMGH